MHLLALALLLTAALPHPLAPGDLSCRQCGAHAFPRAAHAHGAQLGGPRVASVAPAPALGPGGTVHALKKSPTASGADGAPPAAVEVAVYSDAVQGSLALGRVVSPSIFPGFTQTRVHCARCEATLGWHFTRLSGGGSGAGGGAAAGAAAGAAGAAGAAAGAAAINLGAASTPASGVVPYEEAEAAVRLQHLSTLPCLLHQPGGWWAYSFCYGVAVEQFHESTRWSMGVPEAQRKIERLTPERKGYYTSHFYARGQHCDETGKGRATEVQYYCCSSGGAGGAAGGVGTPHILDLSEPGGAGTCKYVLRVCVPALCAEHPLARALTDVFKVQATAAAAAAAGAAGLEAAAGQPPPPPPAQPEALAQAPPAPSPPAAAESIPHKEMRAPSAAYEPEAMPGAFFAAALSNVVGEEEVAELAGRHWGGSGGPVQFK